MKRIVQKTLLLILLFIFCFLSYHVEILSAASCLQYNREDAVSYAQKYTSETHGTGKDEDQFFWNTDEYNAYTHNDCTNFVSQALKAGGLTEGFDARMCEWPVPCHPRAWGDCEGCVDNKRMVIRPHPFPEILQYYFCAEATTSFPSNLKKGDVVVMGTSWVLTRRHSSIVVKTGGTFDTTYVATHSNDHLEKPLEKT